MYIFDHQFPASVVPHLRADKTLDHQALDGC